jgi:hypothetical protein
MGREGAKRSTGADKQYIGISWRPTVLQVFYYRISDLLGQRKSSLTTPFPRYVNPGAFPIDIAQTKLEDISCPQSQTREEKQNRSIPPADGRVQITGSYDTFHFLRLHIPR